MRIENNKVTLEVVQEAGSLKWFVLQNNLMDTDKPFDTEREAKDYLESLFKTGKIIKTV